MAGQSEIIIDMQPNSNGVFEAGKVSKVKLEEPAKEDVRPDANKARPHNKGRRKPVKSIVPQSVNEFAEGVQAGLDIVSGIGSLLKVLR